MDYLKTNQNGGMPFDLDDLRWESDAVRAVFEMIGEGLRNSSQGFIVWGCSINSGSPDILNEGAVYLNGEFYHVPAQIVTEAAAGYNSNYWQVSETADPSGDEVFEDTVTRSTYMKRTANLVNPDVTPRTNQITFGNTPSLASIWATRARLAADVATLNAAISSGDQLIQTNLNAEVASLDGRLVDTNKRLFNFGFRNFDCRSVSDLGDTFTRPSLMTPSIVGTARGRTDFFNGDQIRLYPDAWYRIVFKSQLRPDSNDWVRIRGSAGNFNFSGDFDEDLPNNAYVSTHSRTVEITIQSTNENIMFLPIEIKDELNVLVEITQLNPEALSSSAS